MTSTLIHGDCIHAMQRLPAESVDLILTDPPYLVNYRSRDGKKVANDNNGGEWLEPAFSEAYRLLKPDSFCVSFYGWSQADKFIGAWRKAGFRIIGHFTFPKRYSSSKGYTSYQHEQAYLLAKGRPAMPAQPISDVQAWAYTGNRLHPTEKPVSVLAKFVDAFSHPGDVVFDPFCGSGSTLVAAEGLGRNGLGMELDASHHLTASRRLGLSE